MTEIADIVVIGGGIVGCACVRELARQWREARIVLLDRGPIAGGTSSSCMGHLMVTPEDAQRYAFSHKSVELWRELHLEAGGFDYAATGALYLADGPDDVPLLEQLRSQFAAVGSSAELLDPGQLRESEPGLAHDLPAALFYRGDGVVLPMMAAGAMLRAAQRDNPRVVVRPGNKVIGMDRSADRITAIRTAAGHIATENVVIAGGIWSPEIAKMVGVIDLAIVPRAGNLAITAHHCSPIRGQMLEVSYLRAAHGAAQADPMRPGEDPGTLALNLQPQSLGSCLIGSTRQFRGLDRTIDLALLRQALQRAARYAPGLLGLPIVRTWAGLRPYSMDGLPWIGPWPGLSGLWVAAGHEGLGITQAPITGLLLAQQVTGQPRVVDERPYLPAARLSA